MGTSMQFQIMHQALLIVIMMRRGFNSLSSLFDVKNYPIDISQIIAHLNFEAIALYASKQIWEMSVEMEVKL